MVCGNMKEALENCDEVCEIHESRYKEFSSRSSDILQLLKKIEGEWSSRYDNLPDAMWTEKDTENLESDLKNKSFTLSLTSTHFAENHSQCLSECRRRRWSEIQKSSERRKER